jgi:uracil phosphoribosyltransferase
MSKNIITIITVLAVVIFAYFVFKKHHPQIIQQEKVTNSENFDGKDMKQVLLTTIRNKNTSLSDLRKATESLASILANEACTYLEKENVAIETPLARTTGTQIKNNVVLVPVLKGGLTMLSAFTNFFKNSKVKVGFIGSMRKKKDSAVGVYYDDLPPIVKSDEIIVLESVLASGGTACNTINKIKDTGGKEEKIILVTLVSAAEGINKIKKELPKVKIVTASTNEKLNKERYVVPGVGKDFGARFYGWE